MKASPLYALLIILLALGIICLVFFFADEPLSQNINAQSYSSTGTVTPWCWQPHCCQGKASLCSRRFDQVVHAMSHNAYSTSVDGFIMPNHNRGIAESLAHGIRGLMLDAVTTSQDGTKLCHNYCSLGSMELTSAFQTIETFMQANPREIITIMFENRYENRSMLTTQLNDIENALISSGLRNRVHIQNRSQPWPTLSDMIANNWRLVIFHQQTDPNSPSWHHLQDAYVAENSYSYTSKADMEQNCNIQYGRNALMLVNHFITSPSASRAWAEVVNFNPFMTQHAQSCQVQHSKVANFLSVDFWSHGDVVQAAHDLNDAIVPASYPALSASAYR